MNQPFWQSKTLAQMSSTEWESLCDGCAKCCLHKLEDEDTDELFFTDISCRLLDTESCRCSDYPNRVSQVPECLVLKLSEPETFDWLPLTCAYRLIAEGKPLADWHPLVSGSSSSVHRAGMSVRGRVVPEQNVAERDYEDHVVYWVDG